DEVYEGRAYVKDDFVQFAVGYFRGDTFYINPIAGTFDMHRSLAHLNNAGKGKGDDEGEMTGESDTEAAGTSAKQIRVKFVRPETERQKKRREASALHREKLIASDSWIPMDVHLKEDPSVVEKFSQMTTLPSEGYDPSDIIETRDLVERGIICGEREQIDLTRSDLLVSHQRIREMPIDQQVKAQLFKARVVATDDIARLVPSISRNELFEYLQQCAHLVQGVWVFQSEFLYHDLTAAHSITPGKLDEHRADMWRCARDLALCLLDAGRTVTRSLLTRCFQINSRDAEEILSSFAVPGNRSWKLRITPDPLFLESPENAKIVLEERRYWTERWAEIQLRIDTTMSLQDLVLIVATWSSFGMFYTYRSFAKVLVDAFILRVAGDASSGGGMCCVAALTWIKYCNGIYIVLPFFFKYRSLGRSIDDNVRYASAVALRSSAR
ncbi:unnamed protein product, partial [Haemonchus placei]|uniref:DNA-directed RNA polymerase III subunit RPC3 n=1 Tax=Haemonchus placei TaxID=6290 RepID=A0A0N4WSB5_HAEPC